MLIEITYNVTDVYMSTTETPVYVEISFEQPGSASAVWGSITGTLSNQTDLQNALNAKLDESTIDGGTEGQILSKASATDFDFAWINNYAKYLATNVRNQTGSTIDAFQVVYISGATGNKPLISLADADTEATSSKTYGVTATAIANNGTGDVVTAGELSGINTSAFNEGDLLWLSTTAGGVVTTPPAEPAHAVFIGYVVRSHPTLGVIDVAIANGYELNELHGVQITTPTDNQGLFYNATSTLWENKSITTALGYTPVPTTRNITINGVTYDLSADRTFSVGTISGSGASGQVTYWTGASAVSGSNNLFWDNTNSRLGIGTNAPVNDITINKSFDGPVRLRIENTSTGGNALTDIVVRNSTGGAVFQITGTGNTIPSVTANQARFRTDSAVTNGFTFLTGTTAPITFGTNDIVGMTMFGSTRNVGIGFTTDPAVRLGVSGDTLLRGSGATSATTALTVQNSSSTNLFTVRNDGMTTLGGSLTMSNFTNITSGNNSIGFESFRMQFNTSFNLLAGQYAYNFGSGGGFTTLTSGATGRIVISGYFSPTSGTATYTHTTLDVSINQTGGANGITRGLYVNPTLTAAADFRAIETTAGNVLFGASGTGFFWDNANGRLGIGTNAPTKLLQVNLPTGVNTISNGIILSRGAGSGTFVIGNGTSNINDFIPAIYSKSSVDNAGFYFSASVFGTSSTFPAMEFQAANSTNTGAIGASQTAVRFANWTTQIADFKGNGNVMIGTTSDLGVRLGVIGDTILRGSGNTSATTALTVQNSSSTNLFTVRNDGLVTVSNALLQSAIVTSSATSTRLAINNTNANPNAGIQLQTNAVGNWSLANYIPGGGTNASFVFYNDRTNTDSLFINGDNNNVGIRTNAPTARLDIPASVTTAASLRIRSGTAPTTPNDGDIWFDGTDIKMRIGGVTKTFTLI